MGAVSDLHKVCFGAYENEGECKSCSLALVCIDETQSRDGYWDELAERELWDESVFDEMRY